MYLHSLVLIFAVCEIERRHMKDFAAIWQKEITFCRQDIASLVI